MPHTISTVAGRILLVDDQPANLRVVTTLLQRQRYEVATANDGRTALDECHRFKPDLILLDMMMPGMDGFELMREIKLDPELMRIPTVFLTAAQDRDLLLRAFERSLQRVVLCLQGLQRGDCLCLARKGQVARERIERGLHGIHARRLCRYVTIACGK